MATSRPARVDRAAVDVTSSRPRQRRDEGVPHHRRGAGEDERVVRACFEMQAVQLEVSIRMPPDCARCLGNPVVPEAVQDPQWMVERNLS